MPRLLTVSDLDEETKDELIEQLKAQLKTLNAEATMFIAMQFAFEVTDIVMHQTVGMPLNEVRARFIQAYDSFLDMHPDQPLH